MKVMTLKGPVELSELTVKDSVEVIGGARKIATEYYQSPECKPGNWPEGDLVRRDVTASMLMPLISEATQGEMN